MNAKQIARNFLNVRFGLNDEFGYLGTKSGYSVDILKAYLNENTDEVVYMIAVNGGEKVVYCVEHFNTGTCEVTRKVETYSKNAANRALNEVISH